MAAQQARGGRRRRVAGDSFHVAIREGGQSFDDSARHLAGGEEHENGGGPVEEGREAANIGERHTGLVEQARRLKIVSGSVVEVCTSLSTTENDGYSGSLIVHANGDRW